MLAPRRDAMVVVGLLALGCTGSRALPGQEDAAAERRADAAQAQDAAQARDAASARDASAQRDARPSDQRPDGAPDVGPSAACFRAAVVLPLVAADPGVGAAGPLPAVSPHVPLPGPRLGDPNQLPPAELARRLAALLWKSEPGLLGARIAACGRLTPSDLEVLVRQMLADPRAVRGIEAFTTWWLNLDQVARLERDPALFPAFGPELRRAMAEEPRRLVVDVVLKGDGRFPTLLTAPYSLVDAPVAALYGRSASVPAGASVVRLDFRPEDQRAGLLTQPAILVHGATSRRNSPPSRGRFVRDRFLCEYVPDPPPEFPPDLPEPGPGQTLRQVIDGALSQNPVCQACHSFMELGYAYEPFDAIGRLRSTENGAPIDASGRTRGQDDRQFQGPRDLGEWVARSDQAAACHARKWMEYALGRRIQGEEEPTLSALALQFRASALDIRVLIASITQTAAFLAP